MIYLCKLEEWHLDEMRRGGIRYFSKVTMLKDNAMGRLFSTPGYYVAKPDNFYLVSKDYKELNAYILNFCIYYDI